VGLAWRARAGQDAGTLSYTSFFPGQHRCGGSLAGLLFPALSIAPERLTQHAPAGQQSIAAAAFTAPAGALWIPLFALRPGNNIPAASWCSR
jgi:hypothetical protein